MKLTATITYDLPLTAGTPQAGDWLKSVRRTTGETLTVYLILKVRLVRRRTRKGHGTRYKLTVQRGYTAQDALGRMTWCLHWHSRKK